MEIKLKEKNKKVELRKIPYGGLFWYCGRLYFKPKLSPCLNDLLKESVVLDPDDSLILDLKEEILLVEENGTLVRAEASLIKIVLDTDKDE